MAIWVVKFPREGCKLDLFNLQRSKIVLDLCIERQCTIFWKVDNPHCHKVQSSTKHPLWSPLSAYGKPSTRPPYLISFTPYTTPTPLPNRPNWKNEDWLDYFKENHPNFWFQKQLKEKVIRKLNLTSPIPAENDANEDYGNTDC